MMSVIQRWNNSMLALKLCYFWVNFISNQILIMFKLVISWIEVPRGWSVVLFEAWVFLRETGSLLAVSWEIKFWKETIVRDHMISWMSLLIVQMLERGHVLSSKEERDEWVSIINCVQLFSMKVSLNIVFNDSCLSMSCVNWSCCWKICTGSKCKNVLIFSMLESVGVHIY